MTPSNPIKEIKSPSILPRGKISMKFREKVTDYLISCGIQVTKVEQEGGIESIVCHVPVSDNEKIESISKQMEKELKVIVQLSNLYGMNVVIVEAEEI